MIFVDKASVPQPASLSHEDTELAFLDIISQGKFNNSKRYKGDDVKEALKQLYHDKCAYCEMRLKGIWGHIEHFRPKSFKSLDRCDSTFAYYWLAFSWDNLLLVCPQCNSTKSSCFDIRGTRAAYNGESLIQLHRTGRRYFDLENPLFFNPEQENPKDYLLFDNRGLVSSHYPRLAYTINICTLNRDDLQELRRSWLAGFINDMDEAFVTFMLYEELPDQARLDYFKSPINSHLNKITPEEEFFAWKSYVVRNYHRFLFRPKQSANHQDYNMVIRFAMEKFGKQNPQYTHLFS